MSSLMPGITAYGRDIPPSRFQVQVYFQQKGLRRATANSFFDYYELRGWQNKFGVQIKDWKMRAWQWIWANGAERDFCKLIEQ